MAELNNVYSGNLVQQYGLDDATMKAITNQLFWKLYEYVKDKRIVKLKIWFFSKTLYWRDLRGAFEDLFGPPQAHL